MHLWLPSGTTTITTNTPKIITSYLLELGFQIEGQVRALSTLHQRKFVSDIADRMGEDIVGKATVLTTAASWSNVYIVVPEAAEVSGYVNEARIAVAAAQTFIVGVYTLNGDGTLTRTASKAYSAAAGVNTFSDVNLPIVAGQYVGFYCSTAPHYTNGVGFAVWFSNTEITTNSAKIVSSPVTLEFGATIRGTVRGGVDMLIDRVGAIEGSKPFAGKKWAALGTSITGAGAYTAPLASLLGAVLTNLGVAGASLGQATNGDTGSLVISNQIASIPTDASLVTLESGRNDFAAAAVNLGVLGDTTTATFYGALYNAVVAIRARAPNALIVFLTPYSDGPGAPGRIGVTNGNGNKIQQFQQAVEDVARYAGCPCVDVGRQSGIGYFTAALFMADDVHPNGAGGARYAAYCNARIKDMAALL